MNSSIGDTAERHSPAQARPASSWGPVEPLTRREVEVLRLVGRGLTNRQVADQLVISIRTVEAHLRSIYAKLGLTSRGTASRYAIEHDLI